MSLTRWLCMVSVASSAVACRSQPLVGQVAASATEVQPAVRLERGACFGRCARYVVEVGPSGALRFEGLANVHVMGMARDTIPTAAVAALVERFVTAKFAAADSAYVEGSRGCGQYYADGPQTTLAVTFTTGLKSVRFDAGCTGAPPFLRRLAEQVDSVANTSRWVTGPGEKK